MKVEEVRGECPAFLGYLGRDSLRNAFALYDLKEERDWVTCYVVSDQGTFQGYLLSWHGRQYPNVVLYGTEEAALALLPRAPPSPCTFLVTPELAGTVDAGREVNSRLFMDYMVVERGAVNWFITREVERLTGRDAAALSALYKEPVKEERDWGQWADRGIAYGVWHEGELVAAAGTHFVSRFTSLIGGVYTRPAFRRRGHAAAVTLAVTRDALRMSRQVGLMVVSTNEAAVALYEKLGYRKAVEWALMDSGTGYTPLG